MSIRKMLSSKQVSIPSLLFIVCLLSGRVNAAEITLETETATTSKADAVESTAPKAAPDVALYEKGGLAGIGLVVGLKTGGEFSQGLGDLAPSLVGELELGYTLPVLQRSFQIFASGRYTKPEVVSTMELSDTRLADEGRYTYEVAHEQAVVTLGLLYRLPLSNSWFRPYAALGARAYFSRVEISGSGQGAAFGTNEETSTEAGFYSALGTEFFVGPGAIVGEFQFGYSKLDGFIVRDSNTGAGNFLVGYRLFL